MIGDEFSKGPYKAAILSGNNQRRFTIKASTYNPPSSPVPPFETTVTVANQTVVLCTNVSNVTQPIPVVSTAVETFMLLSDNTTAFITLKNPLDYEASKLYDLLIELTDTNSGRGGNITIKVRDLLGVIEGV